MRIDMMMHGLIIGLAGLAGSLSQFSQISLLNEKNFHQKKIFFYSCRHLNIKQFILPTNIISFKCFVKKRNFQKMLEKKPVKRKAANEMKALKTINAIKSPHCKRSVGSLSVC